LHNNISYIFQKLLSGVGFCLVGLNRFDFTLR